MQLLSQPLKDLVAADHPTYQYRQLGGVNVDCCSLPNDDWKIALMDQMVEPVVKW